jgi:hypothetical protein
MLRNWLTKRAHEPQCMELKGELVKTVPTASAVPMITFIIILYEFHTVQRNKLNLIQNI